MLTWNVRGFRAINFSSIEVRTDSLDLIVFTETLCEVVTDIKWTEYNCLWTRAVRLRGPGCGGVAIIHDRFTTFRMSTSIQWLSFQKYRFHPLVAPVCGLVRLLSLLGNGL